MNTCGVECNFTISKNNTIYLEQLINSKNKMVYHTICQCAFPFAKCNDTYEWRVSSNKCNDTNLTTFRAESMDKMYATNIAKTYTWRIGHNRKKYVVIEIPHYKESFEESCLNISVRGEWWNNGINVCNGDYVTGVGHNDISNIIIGCTYPDQTGGWDIKPDQIYTMESIMIGQ